MGSSAEPPTWRPRRGRAEGRRKLGEVLVATGALKEGQLQQALAERAGDRRERLGTTIARLGFASEEEIAQALAEQFKLSFAVAGELPADPTMSEVVPETLARRHAVVPLCWDDDVLVLACTDPTDVVAVDDAKLAAGADTLRRVVVTGATLEVLHGRVYATDTDQLIEAVDDADDEEEEVAQAAAATEAPIVRLAERLLHDAVAAGASDMHIEPAAHGTHVRYRIDGVLHQATTVPRNASAALLSRLKLLAQMDIAERRLPQDGRMRLRSPLGEVDLRAATLPALHGETLVLRLLRKDDEQLRIDDVGFDDDQRAAVAASIERPQGLVLLTGPTGSGKTSTLYALLRELAGESRNIVTLEDPVEYQLERVNQTQVNPRIGLTFPKTLRTVLRQDPDVVMVGEIRDPETAELALQASLTGHLVLSTLHTNDAPGAMVRLRDLGIPPYLVANALTVVVAQRLVRCLCRACARPDEPATAEHDILLGPGERLLTAVGCQQCGRTGYRGRTGLFETLPVQGRLPELIASQASDTALRQTALAQGMRTLRSHGLAKARQGVTSLQEVLRVTPDDEADDACGACAQAIEPEFAHCPWCGHDLQPPACGACGRELRNGWNVCPDCGAPRGAAASDLQPAGERSGRLQTAARGAAGLASAPPPADLRP